MDEAERPGSKGKCTAGSQDGRSCGGVDVFDIYEGVYQASRVGTWTWTLGRCIIMAAFDSCREMVGKKTEVSELDVVYHRACTTFAGRIASLRTVLNQLLQMTEYLVFKTAFVA